MLVQTGGLSSTRMRHRMRRPGGPGGLVVPAPSNVHREDRTGSLCSEAGLLPYFFAKFSASLARAFFEGSYLSGCLGSFRGFKTISHRCFPIPGRAIGTM